ncbi:MAG TPA: GNAT family N-acetyltransferase [Methylomirabilota bacterium]|nr:GNAT family N-acetyltransferase [Methylomirabilota bacterium]
MAGGQHAIVPFRCEVCGARFTKTGGGACAQCRRICCTTHLVTQLGSKAKLCAACANSGIRCARLRELPAGVQPLVTESEQAGMMLVRRLVDEWLDGSNRFDRPGEALFGAWRDARLVGVCGLNIDPYADDNRIGRVRHLYVLVEARRHGVARALMAETLAAARGRFPTLRLSTSNPAAARLYESLGFRPVTERHCTHLLSLA